MTIFHSQNVQVLKIYQSVLKNRDSLLAQMVKSLPAMRDTWVRSLDQEDPLEKEMATHSSILAWKIPWTEEPGGLQSIGSQRVGHDWATSLSYELVLAHSSTLLLITQQWLIQQVSINICHITLISWENIQMQEEPGIQVFGLTSTQQISLKKKKILRRHLGLRLSLLLSRQYKYF